MNPANLPPDFRTGEWVDRVSKMVDEVKLKECYRGDKKEKREFPRTSPEGIAKSVSKCHDVNQKIIGGFDDLRKETDRRLRRIKLVLGTLNAFLATVAAVLALLKFL